ncbi:SDR family NAD(P)-dependent oxidoreductase [Providencia manganoxydans]|uniref:SDR family NAD(P)-dependent oxidoreductase n=1 Tax=Providencia manganoxydans TaxID=2923283 RepID=A0ABX7ABW8_9GAMM|nr:MULTISPECIES: SDR family NAD(P)-dependent oxidoreductase [Providencia]MDX4946391.1 SDR family NAD(P)-dependent oxidoreductase [Providencia manganoxydans]QQO61276.1 SDR family NAD(P)-dependent oxidoreductase [Providencia manganoxydans]HEF8773623.1 SDR family NAD(P)-dependent oxidoreductase [Providencia stuartii]
MKQQHYAVITGASSGIGRSIAKAFAKKGMNIIAVARRDNLLVKLKDEIAGINPDIKVIVKKCDLSSTEQAIAFYHSLTHYQVQVWVNNAGMGYYGSVSSQPVDKIQTMLNLNIQSLVILSSLYINDYRDIADTQLINISSAGGYTIVPNAVTYCASKFFVSSFTEGLARELIAEGAQLRAKVLAPAATKTEFGQVANNVEHYDYDVSFGTYHTSEQLAEFAMALYDSDSMTGYVDRESFNFQLVDGKMLNAYNSKFNQKS